MHNSDLFGKMFDTLREAQVLTSAYRYTVNRIWLHSSLG